MDSLSIRVSGSAITLALSVVELSLHFCGERGLHLRGGRFLQSAIRFMTAAALVQPPHDTFSEVAENGPGIGPLGLDLDKRILAGAAVIG